MSSSSTLRSRPNPNEVEVLWDFENCWVPQNYILANLKQNIQASLSKVSGQNLVITGKVKAFGPGQGPKFQQLNQHSRDIEVIRIPQENMRCDGGGDDCYGNVVTNHGSPQEQIMRKTDVADKFMILQIMCESLDGRKLLIITGDSDFGDFIESLRAIFPNLYVMVASLENSTHQLRTCGKKNWIWTAMINGGPPLSTIPPRRGRGRV